MAYDIGTTISFSKKKAADLFKPATEFAIGTRILFVDWLSPIATLDLSVV